MIFLHRIPSWFVFATLTLSAATAEPPESPRAAVVRLTRSHFPKFFLSYSPDGSHLAYTRHHDHRRAANKVLMGLRIVAADGGGDRPLLSAFDSQVQIQEHAAWRPDGRAILISGGGNDTGNSSKDVFICDVDERFAASNLRKVKPGESAQLGEQPAWRPDGRQFVFARTNRSLVVVDADGSHARELVQTAGHYCFQPAWSPDGEWIAFAADRDGNCELYKIRSDGTELTRLTNEPGIDCRPKWSPDAQWLAFTSNREGNEDLFLVRADGAELLNLTRNPAVDDHAAWSPDGRSIAFVSMRDGGFDLYRLEVPSELGIGATPPPAGQRAPAVRDLVAHYSFDDEAAPTVRDRSGRNHLELHGPQVVGEAGRGALAFDGKDDFALGGNGTGLAVSGPLTLSVWLWLDKPAGNGYVLSKHGWNIYVGPDRLARFETRTAADDAWDTLSAVSPVAVGGWTFVSAVFDPQQAVLSIYVDGKLSATRPRRDGTIGATAAYPLVLGAYDATRSQFFAGQLDEVRVYQRALGAEEIAKEFAEQSPLVQR